MIYEQRIKLCSVRVTLNGRPALIAGARNRFATVATIDGCESHEWSWEAVERIVARDGRFKV